jgi:sporulation protein YunB
MTKNRKKSHIKLINIGYFQLKYRFFAVFILIFISIFAYVKLIAVPIIINNTESQIRVYASKSINYAVAETMNQNVSYGELINIVRDKNDNVSYIEANAVRINLLSKTMSRTVMSNFLEFAKLPIKISVGSFSGIDILSGVGPKIAFSINPYGQVDCYFTSSFKSAGINQTYHKLYMTISLNVNIVFPFRQLKVESRSEVLLSESLIVGEIPEVYLNSGTLDEMLNLVPERFSS